MVVGAALVVVLGAAVITVTVDARRNRTAAEISAAEKEQEIIDASLEKNIDTIAKDVDDFVESITPEDTGEEEGNEPEDQTTAAVVPDIPVESVKLFINDRELSAYRGDDYDYDISVGLGAQYQLSFTVVPESRMSDVTAEWSCTDTTKLAVTQSGKITGLTKGTVYLYCKVENATASVVVRVG